MAGDPRARTIVPIAAILALAATGCIAPRSYVDPALGRTSYSDFQPKVEPKPVALRLEFRTRGKPNAQATTMVTNRTRTILLASRLFSEVEPPERRGVDRLEIVMDNVGDVGAAVAKGIGTGLTLGLVGSTVTDSYVFTATFTPLGRDPVTKEYRHAIYSTVGAKAGPPGLQPMSPQEAFDRVLEELILRLLLDLRLGEHL